MALNEVNHHKSWKERGLLVREQIRSLGCTLITLICGLSLDSVHRGNLKYKNAHKF
jgi:hypothetical protein